MRVVIPFAAEEPKTRLADRLDPAERLSFARAMLDDVLDAVRAAGGDPEVLATASLDPPPDARVTVDDRRLTPAVNAALDAGRSDDSDRDDDPVGVVMSDLALATPASLRRLFAGSADVAVAPGRGGGTNALAVRHPEFEVDYHGASYLDHRRIAADAGASLRTVDSFRLATDVDEPADLTELLIHGDGAARDWLADAGFELDADEGRVGVRRDRDRTRSRD